MIRLNIFGLFVFGIFVFGNMFLSCNTDFDNIKLGECPIEKQIICLTSDANEAPANGKDIVVLTIHIPSKSIEREVTFLIPETLGSFLQEPNATNKSLSKTVSQEGEVSALLQVGYTPGTYNVVAKIEVGDSVFTDNLIVELMNIGAPIIEVDFDLDATDWIADGETLIKSTVSINNFNGSNPIYEISLSDGFSFSGGDPTTQSFNLNLQNKIDFFLKLGSSAGFQTMSVKGSEVNSSFKYFIGHSYPDYLDIVSQTQNIKAIGDTLDLDLYALRSSGKISDELNIEWNAFYQTEDATNEYGYFENQFLVSEAGKQQYNNRYFFPMLDSLEFENVFIVSSIRESGAVVISDTLQMKVIE